jgi:hypothetical protein
MGYNPTPDEIKDMVEQVRKKDLVEYTCKDIMDQAGTEGLLQ